MECVHLINWRAIKWREFDEKKIKPLLFDVKPSRTLEKGQFKNKLFIFMDIQDTLIKWLSNQVIRLCNNRWHLNFFIAIDTFRQARMSDYGWELNMITCVLRLNISVYH